jgi:hypothetical protein
MNKPKAKKMMLWLHVCTAGKIARKRSINNPTATMFITEARVGATPRNQATRSIATLQSWVARPTVKPLSRAMAA